MLEMRRTLSLLTGAVASYAIGAPSLNQVGATAGFLSDSKLCLTDSHQVFVFPCGKTAPSEVLSPEAPGRILQVAAYRDQVAWMIERTDPLTQEKVTTLETRGSRSVVLSADQRQMQLAYVSGTPALCGVKRILRCDFSLDALIDTDPSLDSEFRKEVQRSAVFVGPNDLIVLVRPYKFMREAGRTLSLMTAYDLRQGSTRLLGSYATYAPQYRRLEDTVTDVNGRITKANFDLAAPGFVWSESGIVALESDESINLPFRKPYWNPDRQELRLGSERPIFAYDSTLYFSDKNSLKTRSGDRQQVYMPWNLKGAMPTYFWPSETGIWSAGTSGTLNMNPERADPLFGFGGFMRVGDLAQNSAASSEQSALLKELESWIGTPYVWGGNTREGVDCSGLVSQAYLSLGYSLPRTSATMRNSSVGRVVHDELKIGDVLTYPGHVAVYVGGGQTIETVKGGVGRSNIWSRTDVVVRRYLRSVP